MPEVRIDIDLDCYNCGATLKGHVTNSSISVEPCASCLEGEYQRGRDEMEAEVEAADDE